MPCPALVVGVDEYIIHCASPFFASTHSRYKHNPSFTRDDTVTRSKESSITEAVAIYLIRYFAHGTPALTSIATTRVVHL